MSAQLDVAARGTRSTTRIPLRTRLRSASVWIVAAFVVLITVIALVLLTGDDEAEEQESGQPAHAVGQPREVHAEEPRREGERQEDRRDEREPLGDHRVLLVQHVAQHRVEARGLEGLLVTHDQQSGVACVHPQGCCCLCGPAP